MIVRLGLNAAAHVAAGVLTGALAVLAASALMRGMAESRAGRDPLADDKRTDPPGGSTASTPPVPGGPQGGTTAPEAPLAF